MPVYQTKKIAATIQLGVWKITETEEELRSLFVSKGYDPSTVSHTRKNTRLKQWIATRILLASFFNDAKILYDNLGKPKLDNGWNISISHSYEFVAIVLNKKEDCGIDIEKIGDKVARIKHKFLNPLDLKKITSNKHLTLYWGAKEALYKYYGKKEVLFLDHLFIEEFSNNKNSFYGKIDLPNFKKRIAMSYDVIDGYILTYTL
jgi:phosphopantetheinyl transferase